MKKIIVFFLITISFSQQELMSQDITVSIDRNTQSIDINDYLTLVSGYYRVDPLFAEVHTSTVGGWSLEFVSVIGNFYSQFQADYSTDYDEGNATDIQLNDELTISNQSSVIICNWPDDHWLDEIISFDLVLRVSGIFDDSQMNINNDSNHINGYSLDKPYPNPFNPTTTISFYIPSYEFVSIKIYDLNGKLVTTLLEEYLNSGRHNLTWNGQEYSSGQYFVKMKSENYSKTEIISLVK